MDVVCKSYGAMKFPKKSMKNLRKRFGDFGQGNLVDNFFSFADLNP